MSILHLYRTVVRTQVRALARGMLALERRPAVLEELDASVRAARAVKLAASIAGQRASMELAHAIESCLNAACQGAISLRSEQIGEMLKAVDLLESLATLDDGREGMQFDGSKRVLLVDDSHAMRELGRTVLRRRGYDVQVAVDGVDGWNTIRTHPFDLVVTDSDMPLVDGIRLIALIRKDPRFTRLPVLIACEEDARDLRGGLEAGADYYVFKRAFEETLAQAVASLIGAAEQ